MTPSNYQFRLLTSQSSCLPLSCRGDIVEPDFRFVNQSMSFFCHLYDHVADEDDEGDRESDDERHVDILRSEASLSVVLDLAVLLESLLLLVLQRVDLLTVVDHLRSVY